MPDSMTTEVAISEGVPTASSAGIGGGRGGSGNERGAATNATLRAEADEPLIDREVLPPCGTKMPARQEPCLNLVAVTNIELKPRRSLGEIVSESRENVMQAARQGALLSDCDDE